MTDRHTPYAADRGRVDTLLKRPPHGTEGFWPRLLADFAKALIVGIAAASALLLATPHHSITDPPISYLVGIVFFAICMLLIVRSAWPERSPRVVERLAVESEQEWKELEGSSGLLRMVRWGIGMGLVIGFPVGLMIAFTLGPAGLMWESRLLTVVGFPLVTIAWTVPVMLLIRSFRIKNLRGYRTQPD